MLSRIKEYFKSLLEKEGLSISSITITVVIGLLFLLIFQDNSGNVLRIIHGIFYLLQHFHR
jgi:phosphomevalonate kinase